MVQISVQLLEYLHNLSKANKGNIGKYKVFEEKYVTLRNLPYLGYLQQMAIHPDLQGVHGSDHSALEQAPQDFPEFAVKDKEKKAEKHKRTCMKNSMKLHIIGNFYKN